MTLAEMSRMVLAAARDPVVIAEAHDVVRPLIERDDASTASAVLGAVRRRLRYTHDPIDVELVKTPRAMLLEAERDRNGRFVGDCDDASVLTAALLAAVGIRTSFAVVPAEAARPGEWSHVYVVAHLADGRSMPLDPIVREFRAGEEVPDGFLSGPRAYFPGGVAGMESPVNYRARPGVPFYGLGSALPSTPSIESIAPVSSAATGTDQPLWQQILSSGSQAAATIIKAKQKPATIRVVNKTSGSSGGLFTNADGSMNWMRIGAAALAVGAVGYVLLRRRGR